MKKKTWERLQQLRQELGARELAMDEKGNATPEPDARTPSTTIRPCRGSKSGVYWHSEKGAEWGVCPICKKEVRVTMIGQLVDHVAPVKK